MFYTAHVHIHHYNYIISLQLLVIIVYTHNIMYHITRNVKPVALTRVSHTCISLIQHISLLLQCLERKH